jgi:hypothetical protein
MYSPRDDDQALWAWDEAHAPRYPDGYVAGDEGRFARGWRLAGACRRMLRNEPRLLFLPLLSATTTLIAGLLVFGPVLWWAHDRGGRWPYGIAIVLGAYLLNFTGTFFGVAFVHAAGRSFRKESVDVRAALGLAVRRIGPIAAWALVATAVSVLLQALARVRGGFLVNVVARWILGAAWALATLFVVPVIASDGVGPVEAARRSIAVTRKRWGESVTGNLYVGGLVLVTLIPALVVAAVGYGVYGSSRPLGVVLIGIAALLIVLAYTVEGAMSNLFSLAVYRYATDGEVVGPFPERDLSDAFRSKPRGIRRRLRR